MFTRITVLLSSAALLSLATTAHAQETEGDAEVPETEIVSYGDFSEHWQDGATWRGMWGGSFVALDGRILRGRFVGTFTDENHFVSDGGRVLALDEDGWFEAGDGLDEIGGERRLRRAIPPRNARFGYSQAEREAWLADCRVLMSREAGYYGYADPYRRDANGALIGGLLGAAAGGFAGNRIADGNRLGGTLIGAGVGGLAGAAVGSLVDGEDRYDADMDPDMLYAARYCEAYLQRYEMSAGQPTRVVRYQTESVALPALAE